MKKLLDRLEGLSDLDLARLAARINAIEQRRQQTRADLAREKLQKAILGHVYTEPYQPTYVVNI